MSLKSSDEMENHIVGHFRIGPEIGKGSFANVYKGYDVRTHKAVAIKSVFRSRLKNQKLIDNLEVEISILKNLKNPHIVALLDLLERMSTFICSWNIALLVTCHILSRKETSLQLIIH